MDGLNLRLCVLPLRKALARFWLTCEFLFQNLHCSLTFQRRISGAINRRETSTPNHLMEEIFVELAASFGHIFTLSKAQNFLYLMKQLEGFCETILLV
jgi:hypothetical protein